MRLIASLILTIVVSQASHTTACANPSSANKAKTHKTSMPSVTVNPLGVARATRTQVVKATANNPDEPPFMNGEPEHLRVRFDDDKLSDYSNYLERQLLIYPVEPYASLFHGKEKEAFDKVMSELQQVIARQSVEGIKELPILPSAEAFEVFHTQVSYPKFKHGSGVAFLSCYMQDEAPVRQSDLFYTFQGLTADGKHYVSLFVPVKAKKLPTFATARQGADYLSKLPRTEFIPGLDQVDEVVASISVK